MFSRSVKFDEESVICGQVGRSETSSSEGASCDIFQHMTATREKEIDTTGCRLQRKTLKQHIDASMGKEVDSTRDLEEEKKCCRKSDEEPQYTIKTRNRTHQENQANPLPSDSEKQSAVGMGINNKTKTHYKQIHHGNSLLEDAIRSKKEIPASMSLNDAERKGIEQLQHHIKSTMKSSKPSSTDGDAGTSKEPANNREQVQPTKPDKRKEDKPDTISGADGNSRIQNCIRSEAEDSDDECCNKDKALETNKKGGKKKVKLLSDIYNTTEDLSKHFIAEVESDITTFTADMKDEGEDLAPIINLKQALRSTEKESWIDAMQTEAAALTKNKTWTLVPRPPNSNIVSCKWLFTKKCDAHGTPIRFKARLVARGFSQIPSIDYHETFSPTLRITSFRLLLAMTAYLNLEVHHVDIETTFLHGDLEETIYMEQPKMMENDKYPDYVCKLHKALYGLRKSPRQ